MYDMKNETESISIWADQTEGRKSDLEDRKFEITCKRKGNKILKEQRKPIRIIKIQRMTDIRIISILKGEEREKRAKSI